METALEFWNDRNSPPFSEAELRTLSRNAAKYAQNKAGNQSQEAREADALRIFGPTGTTSSVPVIDIKGQIVDVLTNQNHTPTQKNDLCGEG